MLSGFWWVFFQEGDNENSNCGIKHFGVITMRRQTGPVNRFVYARCVVAGRKSEGTCMTDIQPLDRCRAVRNCEMQRKWRKDTDHNCEEYND